MGSFITFASTVESQQLTPEIRVTTVFAPTKLMKKAGSFTKTILTKHLLSLVDKLDRPEEHMMWTKIETGEDVSSLSEVIMLCRASMKYV